MTDRYRRLDGPRAPITPKDISQAVARYCQFQRHRVLTPQESMRAAQLLLEVSKLLAKANRLSIAAYVTRQPELKLEADELRAQVVDCLAEAMRIRARAVD